MKTSDEKMRWGTVAAEKNDKHADRKKRTQRCRVQREKRCRKRVCVCKAGWRDETYDSTRERAEIRMKSAGEAKQAVRYR